MTELLLPRLQSAFGLAAFVGLAWLMSERRSDIPKRLLAATMLSLFIIALLFSHLPLLRNLLNGITGIAQALKEATLVGTSFTFGHVGGGDAPFAITDPAALFSFAFQALPLIILLSGIANVLFHWGILSKAISAAGMLLQRLFGLGGAVGLTSAANLIFGPAESALLVRPYLAGLSRSELFCILTVGTSTVSGTVMVLYATILEPVDAAVLGHVIVASLMSLPAALLVAQIMVPPEEPGQSETHATLDDGPDFHGTGDAFTRGISDGGLLFLNIIAAVFAFIALVALIDILLAAAPTVAGSDLSLVRIVGWICTPIAWLTGMSWQESAVGGQLVGSKVVLNELIAYINMANLDENALSARSSLIMIYSLCGFANAGSIGLLISGFGTLVPEHRLIIIKLAPRAIISGTIASLMTGAVIGVIT